MCKNTSNPENALASMEEIAFEIAQEKVGDLLGQWITPTLVGMVEELTKETQRADLLAMGTDALTIKQIRKMAVAAIFTNLTAWVDMTKDQPINELF